MELHALPKRSRSAVERLPNVGHEYNLPQRQVDLAAEGIKGLELRLTSVQWKQAEAKARREAPKREAERRAAREHHALIDGYTVWGTLGDWADLSDDPDQRRWADMFLPGTEPRKIGRAHV